MIGGRDRGERIADGRVDECQVIVSESEIRAQIDRLVELDERLVVTSPQPESAPHRPMRGGIAVVGEEALPRGGIGPLDFDSG